MIVEGLVNLLVGIVGLFAQVLGTANPPSVIAGVAAQLSTFVGYGASMGAWVPWSVFGAAVAAIATCLGISLAVRLVRMAISLFTGGGGAAS